MCDVRWLVAFLISSHLLGTGARSKIVTLADCRDYLRGQKPLRVGLAQGAPAITLTCRSAATLRLDARTVTWPAERQLVIVREAGAGLVLTDAGGEPARICLFDPAGAAATEVLAGELQGQYQGSIEVTASAAGLAAVNRVPLETYLAGVVPAEMPASFPVEALKAQAIVARTYALYQLGRHESEGFDLCAGTHCQVYRGTATSPRSTRAVAATGGHVLTFDGVLVKAVYHSTCGGTTVDAWKAWWDHALPYLRGRPDAAAPLGEPSEAGVERFLAGAKGWCSASSKYRWRVEMDWREVQQKVAANLPSVTYLAGRKPGALLDLRVAARTASGRIRRLVVVTDAGEESVWGDSIRWLFGIGKPGPGGLPSTFCTMTIRRDAAGAPTSLIVQGGGWGHGIGMCQVGAAARARAGQSARQILDAYYSGVKLARAQ